MNSVILQLSIRFEVIAWLSVPISELRLLREYFFRNWWLKSKKTLFQELSDLEAKTVVKMGEEKGRDEGNEVGPGQMYQPYIIMEDLLDKLKVILCLF